LGYNVVYHPLADKAWQWGDVLKVRLSEINHNNCDITFWHRAEGGFLDRQSYGSWDQYRGRAMPESWIFPTHVGKWEGLDVNIPADAKNLVTHRYGRNWENLLPVRHDRTKR
jgi:hypothetical protein